MKSLILFINFLFSVSAANAQLLEYGYVFHETTGITSHILKDGKEIPIQFSSDSNQEQLKMLDSLKWNILYPNSSGDKIFLIGELTKDTKNTPEKANMPSSQTYQNFKLIGWYIKIPFMEMVIKDINDLPHEFRYIKRNLLKKSDFSNLDNIELILTEFQKK
jgi:hypothetical protein